MRRWTNSRANETMTGKLVRVTGDGWMIRADGCVWLLNNRTWSMVKDEITFWQLVTLAALACISLCAK